MNPLDVMLICEGNKLEDMEAKVGTVAFCSGNCCQFWTCMLV
jgi:hypothetical protein